MENNTPVILIVDDEEENVFSLKAMLEAHGFACCTASGGRQALSILRQVNNIDLVLVDLVMPDMDGLELMREIRSLPSLQRITLVALTEHAMGGDGEKYVSTGADACISKPVDSDRLLQLIVDCQSGAE